VVVRQIDRAARNAEIQNLTAIGSNYITAVLKTQAIPDSTTWASAVANYLGLPVSGIIANARGVTRTYLVDPGAVFPISIPYSQSVTGFWPAPTARVLLISSIDAKNGLPALTTATDFNSTWNWDPAINSALPGGNWAGWNGRAYDVVIQRINLQPLFHHVLLFSQSAPMYYAINGAGNTNNPVKTDSYYLDGSLLGLYTNYVVAPNLQATEIINRDMSRYYFNTWGDQPGPGPPGISTSTFTNLDNLAYAFVSETNAPPGSLRGDNTVGVADWLLAYMASYSSYANTYPCFAYTGQGNNNKVPEIQMLSDVINCFGNGGQAQGGCQIVP
jgi:hypothetical protein